MIPVWQSVTHASFPGASELFSRIAAPAAGPRELDAGRGTGVVTLALRDAMLRRGIEKRTRHGFDLTPAMLERFPETLRTRAIEDVFLGR